MTQRSAKVSLLAKCLIASSALHFLAIYYLVKHPISLSGKTSFLFLQNKPTPKCVDSEDGIAIELKEFFEEFAYAPFSKAKQIDSSRCPSISLSPLEQEEEKVLISLPHMEMLEDARLKEDYLSSISLASSMNDSLFLIEEHYSLNLAPAEIDVKSLISPTEILSLLDLDQKSNFIEDRILSREDLPPSSTSSKEGLLPPDPSSLKLTQDLSLLPEKPSSFSPQKMPRLDSGSTNFPLRIINENRPLLSAADPRDLIAAGSLSEIEDYLPFQALFSLDWSDHFSVESSFFPDGNDYVFSLTLTPKKELEIDRMPQNFYFLIDVSGEVEKHKAAVFKRSTFKALTSLQSQDTFNIFLLDKTLVSLSPYNLPFSLSSLRLAEEFLEKKQDRPFFSSFNLLESLQESFSRIETDEEVHTIVLLSNGQFDISSAALHKTLTELVAKKKGKISLSAAAIGKNNNLVSLDMLTSLFGGKVLYSDTHASFPRKLTSFIKNLQSPLAKDIHLLLEPQDPKAKISGISMSSCNLYAKEPFVIMGRVSKLSPIELTLEGKNNDHAVLMRKKATFEEASQSTNAIKKEWLLRKTNTSYERFLQDAKNSHLKEAKDLLTEAHGRVLGQ